MCSDTRGYPDDVDDRGRAGHQLRGPGRRPAVAPRPAWLTGGAPKDGTGPGRLPPTLP